MFQIELAPGAYVLIFDYGPPSGPSFSDHGGVVCLYSSRWANTKFILSYDVPKKYAEPSTVPGMGGSHFENPAGS